MIPSELDVNGSLRSNATQKAKLNDIKLDWCAIVFRAPHRPEKERER
jgi:hypothetical protein